MGSLMVSSSYYYEIYVPATLALFLLARSKKKLAMLTEKQNDRNKKAVKDRHLRLYVRKNNRR